MRGHIDRIGFVAACSEKEQHRCYNKNMKSSQKIIAHITKKPYFRKIGEKKCIGRLISFLPPQLQKAVMFTYIRNGTLFFVLNHPGLKMEFNYKKSLIKSLLKKIKDIDETCQNLEVTDVAAFVSNKIRQQNEPVTVVSTFTYKERATGRFYNFATDPGLKALFDQIKSDIRQNAAS